MVKRGSNKGKRLYKKGLAKKAAAVCKVPEQLDIAIVGGGPAGIVCACVAKENNPNAKIAVFEKEEILGKSILATGNGRCNVTNTKLTSAVYRNEDFVQKVFGENPLDQIFEFFKRVGIHLVLQDEVHGNIFPASNHAESVRAPLVQMLVCQGVFPATMREVLNIKKVVDGFQIMYSELFRAKEGTSTNKEETPTKMVKAKKVVLATNCEKGIGFAKQFELKIVPFEHCLVPLKVKDYRLSSLSGERVYAALSLANMTHDIYDVEVGEVMLQGNIISGIPALNASRHTEACTHVLLDLFPQLEPFDLVDLIPHEVHHRSYLKPIDLLGLITMPLAQALIENEHMTAFQFAKNRKIIEADFVSNATEFPGQIERGGIAVDELEPYSFETTTIPGLYVIGNLVDVDGPCGGFNLSWCWISGMRSGKAVAKNG